LKINYKIYIKTISIKYLMSDLKIFNEKPFFVMIIEPGSIKNLDWNDPNYIQNIISLPFVKTYQIKPDQFFNKLEELLKIGSDGNNTHLMTETISDEVNYIYEIIYLDTLNKKSNLEHNELATLLHMENEIVKGNCMLIKSYTPTLIDTNENNVFVDFTSSDLYKVLKRRGFTSVVVWEGVYDSWREEEFFGDLENYANKFFDSERYTKIEIAFLKHNINIWYLKSEYGMKDVLGTLVSCPIEKCFIFTKLTEDIRGHITLDEVNKILKLSKILEPPFKPDNKWLEEQIDKNGKKIIKNKYRILDNVYLENINKF